MDTAIAKTLPSTRPFAGLPKAALQQRLEAALEGADGVLAAHCVHESWMRGESGSRIERALERLWAAAADSLPDWLPMRYIDWLPSAYEISASFHARVQGRSNVYMVLLDYRDSRAAPYGVYVGMSKYSPMQRFDQHKAGIRAAGSVLKRGLEVLTGPTMHLQFIQRAEAERIEMRLAEALAASGIVVKGGH